MYTFDYVKEAVRGMKDRDESQQTLNLAQAAVGAAVLEDWDRVRQILWEMDTSPREFLWEAMEFDGLLPNGFEV